MTQGLPSFLPCAAWVTRPAHRLNGPHPKVFLHVPPRWVWLSKGTEAKGVGAKGVLWPAPGKTVPTPHEVLQSVGCGDMRTEVRMSPRRTAEAVGHTCLYPLKRKERV